MSFGIVAEDASDAETLKQLVKRAVGENQKIHTIGCGGCGSLCRKGSRHLKNFQRLGVTRFIVCHDADGDEQKAMEIREKVLAQVIRPSGCQPACALVPVQELEAWMIADHEAIAAVIPSFQLQEVARPELQANPKGWLENASRVKSARPLYRHATHNPRVAEHIRISVLYQKCPSARVLFDFLHK